MLRDNSFMTVLRLEGIAALTLAMTVFAKDCCADDSVSLLATPRQTR
jgi:hypothetical protein